MTTVNISFQDQLLAAIDEVAKHEHRSRSELLREAARSYIERQQRWNTVFEIGQQAAAEQKLNEDDVAKEIAAVRRKRRRA